MKIVAESLSEYMGENEMNEGLLDTNVSKKVKAGLVNYMHYLVKNKKEDMAKNALKMSKELKEAGWPKDDAIKKDMGDPKFKSLVNLANAIERIRPTFAAGPSGAVTASKGKVKEMPKEEKIAEVSKAIGASEDEIKELVS